MPEDTGSQWLIEATERGLGAEAFQTPVLDAKITEFSLMSRDGELSVMLMRSESTDGWKRLFRNFRVFSLISQLKADEYATYHESFLKELCSRSLSNARYTSLGRTSEP